ncbi:MAG TPA: dTDP-4-dehydrorhamnose reductase [Fimbriimonas sp.]|nr:dTDP-4-dehydrorhamnose reductase [Fimbriimonas sp.]
MKVTVLGATGLLGTDLAALLRNRGHEVIALSSKDLDISDHQAVMQHPGLAKKNAHWVINCAAYTKVDLAESEPELARDVNEEGVLNLCERLQNGPRLLHVSTDFVFDGLKPTPYVETDATNPLGIYGQTKLQGEHYAEAMLDDAIIFRTSWLWGSHGQCFPKTMIHLWESGRDFGVVNDQFGCPTHTLDLSTAIVEATERKIEGGIYHAAGHQRMSWHGFAEMVLTFHAGKFVSVRELTTAEYPTAATRPANSVLSTEKLDALGIMPWEPVSAERVRDLTSN